MPGVTTSFVQGASRGLGLELVRQLLAADDDTSVFASCRNPQEATELQSLVYEYSGRLRIAKLDVSDEATIIEAAKQLEKQAERVSLIINVAGVLHGPGFAPEKKLAQVTPEALRTVFEVNAFGPLLVAKHFHRLLRHDHRSVFANLSARIGSISDNRLGGWYAYRGSKAAQNMFTKTLSIELGRAAPNSIVIGLHPGTVDTRLSEPFQNGVPKDRLFTPEHSVARLLTVIGGVTPADTGKVFDFRGDEILP